MAVEDIHKLKKDNIAALSGIDDKKFQSRYLKVYAVLKDLPQELRSKYNIRPDMPKEEAIAQLKALDKKKIYEVIDLLPDQTVAAQFHAYVARHKVEMGKVNFAGQIQAFWARITRFNSPPKKNKK